MRNRHELDELVREVSTVSDKIRVLNQQNVPKAEIAAYLNVSPNHVYSTISRDRRREKNVAPTDGSVKGEHNAVSMLTVRGKELVMLQMSEKGELILANEAIEAMELGDRAELVIIAGPGDLHIMTREKAIQRFKDLVAAEVPTAAALADAIFAGSLPK